MDMFEAPPLSRDEQLAALTPQVMKDYAEGRLSWSQIRHELDVEDFSLILLRLGDEGLKLPQAPADRPTKARGWLRDAISEMQAKTQTTADRPIPSE